MWINQFNHSLLGVGMCCSILQSIFFSNYTKFNWSKGFSFLTQSSGNVLQNLSFCNNHTLLHLLNWIAWIHQQLHATTNLASCRVCCVGPKSVGQLYDCRCLDPKAQGGSEGASMGSTEKLKSGTKPKDKGPVDKFCGQHVIPGQSWYEAGPILGFILTWTTCLLSFPLKSLVCKRFLSDNKSTLNSHFKVSLSSSPSKNTVGIQVWLRSLSYF